MRKVRVEETLAISRHQVEVDVRVEETLATASLVEEHVRVKKARNSSLLT